MDNENGVFKPRRVVYDVNTKNKHNKRRKKRSDFNRYETKQENIVNEVEHDQPTIPLELAPLIKTAIDYGRKTHALGALKSAKALAMLASKLKSLRGLDLSNARNSQLLQSMISEAEVESNNIINIFDIAYNANDDIQDA
jgi:hypothetical protein